MAALVVPLLALAVVWRARAVPPSATRRTPFYKVLSAVWGPGLGLALSSVGFGLITAFIALLFAARDWDNASLAFTAFGLAFIGARILFGHLPDKVGGAQVALVCVIVEAIGQLLIWKADSATIAYLGAALTGFGYSLAFPGFGVEAVRRAPPQSRSLAMGAYVAFLDISLGISSPLAGALAGAQGIASVYLAGAVAAGLSLVVALRLLATGPSRGGRGPDPAPARPLPHSPGAATNREGAGPTATGRRRCEGGEERVDRSSRGHGEVRSSTRPPSGEAHRPVARPYSAAPRARHAPAGRSARRPCDPP